MVMVDPNHKSPFSTGLMALSSRPDREVTFRWRLASPNTTDPWLAVHSISHFESVGIWLHKWEKKPLRSQRLWAQYWLSSLSGNQRPDHLWWTCVLYCACHAICIFPDPLQMSHSCQSCHRFSTKSSRFAHCGRAQNPLRLPHKTALQRPKVVRTCGAFSILSSKCASRRTLFEHLNFQKCSEAEVFCTFWLRNVLRATTACNFKSLIWPPVTRTRRFSKPTVQPSGNTVNRDFSTFSPASSFFWLFLFSDLLWLFQPLLFHLSEVWLLNFLPLWIDMDCCNVC